MVLGSGQSEAQGQSSVVSCGTGSPAAEFRGFQPIALLCCRLSGVRKNYLKVVIREYVGKEKHEH
jgi:hypothetical protein